MIVIRRILCPTDFSDHSAEATKYAHAFAEQFDAELHLLHVLEIHAGSTPLFGAGLALPARVQESKQRVDREFDRLLESDRQNGKRVVRATAEGVPFVKIIGYAKENDIDMIIMGTHGRSGVSHMMIGSVAERVVRKSPCPVLTVRPDGHQFVMP